MRKQFEASSDGPTPFGPWFALGAHWYGSLYVVVEGWKELGLKDAIIDALLSHAAYPNLLRQFRNGVYHYQSNIMAPKLLQFIARTRHVLWVMSLHSEFVRVFWDWMSTLPGPDEQVAEIKESLKVITGGFPQDVRHELAETLRYAERLVASAGPEDDLANEIKRLVEEGSLMIDSTTDPYTRLLEQIRMRALNDDAEANEGAESLESLVAEIEAAMHTV
jgi:hypothetical protein